MLSGLEIRDLRERLDLHQTEFGKLMGVAHGTEKSSVAMWEDERRQPCFQVLRHMRTLIAVSNALYAVKKGALETAKELLEDTFAENGASILDSEFIDKITREIKRNRKMTDKTVSGVYTIKFVPKRYRIKQQTNIKTGEPYWAIVDYERDLEIGFTVTENDAKTIVLSLDYMHAVIAGDLSVQRELTRALEKLRN